MWVQGKIFGATPFRTSENAPFLDNSLRNNYFFPPKISLTPTPLGIDFSADLGFSQTPNFLIIGGPPCLSGYATVAGCSLLFSV